MVGASLLQPGNPTFRRIRPTRLLNPRLNQSDARFCTHQLCHAHQRRVVGKPSVIIEEEEELAVDVGDARIATSRDSEILRQPQLLDLVRNAFRLPAIPHADDVEVDALLRQQRFEPTIEVVQSLALAENNDTERVASIVFETLGEDPG